jgi:predicted DNA binding protein
MTYYELEFRFQHECPYNDLTRRHPSAVIALWCNWSKHAMEISCKDIDTFQEIQADLKKFEERFGSKILRKTFSANNVQLVLTECACDKIPVDMSAVIEKFNCLEIVPEIYTGGWEYYRIVAFSQKDIRKLFDHASKLGTFQIMSRKTVTDTSVHESFIISTNSLVGSLTRRQQQALITALDYGYYRVPKKTKTEDLAKRLGQPRTTYEEHLRKAESKVLSAVAPYIQLGGKEKRAGRGLDPL